MCTDTVDLEAQAWIEEQSQVGLEGLLTVWGKAIAPGFYKRSVITSLVNLAKVAAEAQAEAGEEEEEEEEEE